MIVRPMAIEFVTKQGVSVLLDNDMAHLAKLSWQLNSVGYLRRTIRVRGERKKYKTLLMHRQIAGAINPKDVVDHINGNKYDNRKINLRVGTQSENLVNRHKWRTTTRGVYYNADPSHRLRPWKWQVKRMGQHYHGSVKTKKEAIAAYWEALNKHGYEWEKR